MDNKNNESAEHPSFWWKLYVDDTHTHHSRADSCQEFTDCLNSIDHKNKWTTKWEVTTHTVSNEEVNIDTRTEGVLVFLDTSVINDDGPIKAKVHRNKTHTDHFNSNYPLEHKRGVVKTLMHRVDSIVSNERDWKVGWLPKLANQPSLESTTFVLSNNK